MPEFTQDWFHYADIEVGLNKLPQISGKILEIGCYEGRSTLWFLEKMSANVTVVDTFQGDDQQKHMGVDQNFKGRFLSNVEPYRSRVTVIEGKSQDILPTLKDKFDLIYIDGSHLEEDVYADGVNSYRLLNEGGYLVFDDYQMFYDDGAKQYRPKNAIDRFMAEFKMEVIHAGWQMILRKKETKKAIVIGSTTKTKDWLENCLNSFGCYDKYPIIVVVNDGFELGKLKWVYDHTDVDEMFLLHDTLEIKDVSMFEEAFEECQGKSYALSDHPTYMGMFLGKYRREILDKMEIPITETKAEAVDQEELFNRRYSELEPYKVVVDPPLVNGNIFEEKFGRKNMVLENEFVKKYKGTWCRAMVK